MAWLVQVLNEPFVLFDEADLRTLIGLEPFKIAAQIV